jgi:hypothetical protein
MSNVFIEIDLELIGGLRLGLGLGLGVSGPGGLLLLLVLVGTDKLFLPDVPAGRKGACAVRCIVWYKRSADQRGRSAVVRLLTPLALFFFSRIDDRVRSLTFISTTVRYTC